MLLSPIQSYHICEGGQKGKEDATLPLCEPSFPLHEVADHVHGQREDDGGVLLRSDGGEGLEVSQLEA